MNAQTVSDVIREALMAAFWIGLPLLAIGFVAGLIMSLVQVVTSLQDPGFATAPRLAAFLAGLIFFLPWMIAKMTAYTFALFNDFSRYAR